MTLYSPPLIAFIWANVICSQIALHGYLNVAHLRLGTKTQWWFFIFWKTIFKVPFDIFFFCWVTVSEKNLGFKITRKMRQNRGLFNLLYEYWIILEKNNTCSMCSEMLLKACVSFNVKEKIILKLRTSKQKSMYSLFCEILHMGQNWAYHV